MKNNFKTILSNSTLKLYYARNHLRKLQMSVWPHIDSPKKKVYWKKKVGNNYTGYYWWPSPFQERSPNCFKMKTKNSKLQSWSQWAAHDRSSVSKTGHLLEQNFITSISIVRYCLRLIASVINTSWYLNNALLAENRWLTSCLTMHARHAKIACSGTCQIIPLT